MVNTHLLSPNGDDIWLFSQNAGVKHSLQPGTPLLPVESGNTLIPKTILFVIPDVSPLKHWTLLLDHKTHPCE